LRYDATSETTSTKLLNDPWIEDITEGGT